jgi:hypothetical protein
MCAGQAVDGESFPFSFERCLGDSVRNLKRAVCCLIVVGMFDGKERLEKGGGHVTSTPSLPIFCTLWEDYQN